MRLFLMVFFLLMALIIFLVLYLLFRVLETFVNPDCQYLSTDCDQACHSSGKTCADYAQDSYGTCTSTSACKNWDESRGCGIPCHTGDTNDNVGYQCKAAGDAEESIKREISSHEKTNMAYACMDWTFRSKRMQAAETAFHDRTGQDVYFGVGSYGNSDPDLGNCYRIKVRQMTKDLIVQNINTGGDVSGTQFDLQVGDGGFGIYPGVCVNKPQEDYQFTMFSGDDSVWGSYSGGVSTRDDCEKLPEYPRLFENEGDKTHIDSLRDLCRAGFDQSVRKPSDGPENSNQTILSIGRVSCPRELTEITGMIPDSQDDDYIPTNPKTNTNECGAQGSNDFCLTRMMDCRKPSGSWPGKSTGTFLPGATIVQPCGQDGYTRIDNRCGQRSCYS